MATPTLTRHRLPGALGELLVDVRAGGRGSPRPAVLVVHGWKGFKDWGMLPTFAERLAQAGFTAVTFNLSGSGIDDAGEMVWPERFGRDTYGAELDDATVVLAALRAGDLDVPPPTSIGLVGHSRGGGIAVLLAAREGAGTGAAPVRALVTWAAIAHADRWSDVEKAAWRRSGTLDVANARTGQVIPLAPDILDDLERRGPALDILAAARTVEVPWLIVHGSGDESVPVVESRELAEASGRSTTRLEILDGAGHTFGAAHPWAGMPAEFRRVQDLSVSWLGKYLQ